MKLVEAQVKLFRNILDSTPVPIQPDVTCLVGKNESGKTAFLHALYRLHPARGNASFSVPTQYPAWREKKDRQTENLEEVTPVRVVFRLDDDDTTAIRERFGAKALTLDTIELSRSYDGTLEYTLPTVEQPAVQHVAAQARITLTGVAKEAKAKQIFSELTAFATELKGRGTEHPDEVAAGTALEAKITEALNNKPFDDVV